MNSNQRKEALAEIKRNALYTMPEAFLKVIKTNKKKLEYECPECHKGAGVYPNSRGEYKLHCFHCGKEFDPVDIIEAKERCTKAEAFARVLELCGYNSSVSPITTIGQIEKKPQPAEQKRPRTQDEIEACERFILKAQADITKTNYLLNRGISYETAKQYGVGFDKDFSIAGQTIPAIVIPYTRYDDNKQDYLHRLTLKYEYQGEVQRYRYRKNGGSGLFNARAISDATPVFIVEGAIDAMSIAEAGGTAVAIQSTSNARGFIKWLQSMQKAGKVKAPAMYIALDNDGNESTTKAVEVLKAGLDKLKICNEVVSVTGQYKDANEALQGNKKALSEAISRTTTHTDNKQEPERTTTDKGETMNEEIRVSEATETTEEKQPEQESKAQQLSAAALFKNDAFWQELEQRPEPISTGLKNIDELLNGGLQQGLYVIGGFSSQGKTTLCLQIADNLTRQHKNVLYISLEQDKTTLIAKSIVRMSHYQAFLNSKQNKKITEKESELLLNGVEEREQLLRVESKLQDILPEFRNVIEYKKQSGGMKEIIVTGGRRYQFMHAPWAFIVDGREEQEEEQGGKENHRADTIEGIKAWANKIDTLLKEENKGRKLDAVFIDYLQRVKTENNNITDKKEIDIVVSELQNMAKKYKLPVVLISSINRQSAKDKVIEMQSFMGSGGIEFTADYLLALSQCESKEITKAFDIVDMKIELLKNRTGKTGQNRLYFQKKYGIFVDAKEEKF